MAYIGTKPTVGNFQICDAISVVNGQAAYTMQVGSVNVIPQSANHMIVSLNGTIQKPNSSFTVSGSTITFSSNLATGDVIDFIQILGDVLDLGVPSDGTVTTAKVADGAITSAKLASGVGGVAGIVSNADATAITIDSSEQVGIGTSNPTSLLELFKAGTTQIKNAYSSTKYSLFGRTGGNYYWSAYEGGAALIFSTSASDNATTERMRITSAGQVGIGETSLGNNTLYVKGNTGSPLVTFYDQRSTSTFDVFAINSDHAGTETRHFLIEADGDVFNTFNSYGSLSDRKFKENETDANSQWNDIKKLKIKNYNLKISPDKQLLGVIAQDLEASGMNGLVKDKPDVLYTETETLPEGKNVGDIKEESYKEVKYSVLYMKSVKALQEAMDRIETLEAKVTALENA
nr:hypothetical protein [uncultured Mediterranean phage uvMED]